MTKIFNFALKIKGGGSEGGTCEVLRPCHTPQNLERAQVVGFLHSPQPAMIRGKFCCFLIKILVDCC